jgi:hypothetical protein
VEGEGCVHGPHVFYDSTPEDLHSRHPFSRCRPEAESDTALDVVALDCEMIYTTAGMSVARVSLVDGAGKEIFDEMVRMTDAVKVMYVGLPHGHLPSDPRFPSIATTTRASLVSQKKIAKARFFHYPGFDRLWIISLTRARSSSDTHWRTISKPSASFTTAVSIRPYFSLTRQATHTEGP